MRDIVRWDPWGDLISLRDAMDRLFEESFVRPPRSWLLPLEGRGVPLDMYETDEDVVVKAAVPGLKPEDIDVTITGDTLTIKGEAKEEKEERRTDYIRQERRYGAFSRSVSLPAGLQTDKAKASFENGILTLSIPKAGEIKPKVIKVKTK